MPASETEPSVPPPSSGADPDDEALLHALASEATREAGWEQLVRRYQAPLHLFASSLTRDAEAADEVVQACWVELWKAVVLKRQTVRQVKGWLYKLASRKALALMRERRKRAAMPAETETETRPASNETESREVRTLLYQLVDDLPDRLRLPVLLHYGPEYNQTEIASLLDCRQSTVSERLSEALARLKHELHQRGLVTLPMALPVLLQQTVGSPPVSVTGSVSFPDASEIASQAQMSGKSGMGAGLKILAWGGGTLALLPLPAYWMFAPPAPKQNLQTVALPVVAQQQVVERPWQSLSGKSFHVPQKAYGAWAWQPGKTEQALAYSPATNGPTYCYVDAPRQTPLEWRGRLESLEARETSFALGLAHPNRQNFSGITWQLEQKHFPIDFHVQIWCDEKGSRMAVKMRGADGSSFVSGAFTGNDLPQQAATDPAQPPAWQEYPKLTSFGLACASGSALRITRMETRALEKSDCWK